MTDVTCDTEQPDSSQSSPPSAFSNMNRSLSVYFPSPVTWSAATTSPTLDVNAYVPALWGSTHPFLPAMRASTSPLTVLHGASNRTVVRAQAWIAASDSGHTSNHLSTAEALATSSNGATRMLAAP